MAKAKGSRSSRLSAAWVFTLTLATLVTTGNASASVVYQFASTIGNFTYKSPNFITSFIAVPNANLTSASTPFGTLDYAQFQPVTPNANTSEIILTTSGAGNLFTYFASADFTTPGVYQDTLLNRGATLTVSSGVPEPSTWAMMLMGLIGLSLVASRSNKAGKKRALWIA